MAKKWKGIQVNFCLFQGEITADPVFNGEYAFMGLQTTNLVRDANGQIVEVPQEIPLMVEPDGPTSVVKNYIKAGRKLMAWCTYKSWKDNQNVERHYFIVKKFDLGDKPYEAQQGGSPPIPSN